MWISISPHPPFLLKAGPFVLHCHRRGGGERGGKRDPPDVQFNFRALSRGGGGGKKRLLKSRRQKYFFQIVFPTFRRHICRDLMHAFPNIGLSLPPPVYFGKSGNPCARSEQRQSGTARKPLRKMKRKCGARSHFFFFLRTRIIITTNTYGKPEEADGT